MTARCLLLLSWALPALAQTVRPLHTRDLTRLSQPQVAAQLGRSDVIFIPVGAVEANGPQPSDRDYIYALAFAMAMAENTGGLYLPGLMWSYPGTTLPTPSTIHLTPSAGLAFLKDTARSLLRQGFRRQVYVSYSHGPATLTAGTLAREFFDETGVPVLYLNLDTYLPRLKLAPAERDKLLYGAHALTGRLEDLALRGEYTSAPAPALPKNEGLATLGRLGFSGSLALGSWINDPMAHAGTDPVAATAAERAAWGAAGAGQLRSIVGRMSLPEAMEALRQHDRYTQEVIVPRLKRWLPGGR